MDEKGLHFSMLTEDGLHMSSAGKLIMAGPRGTVSIQVIATFLAGFILVLLTLFVVLNLIHSKEGRAIKAIRDNRIAAESVGINVMAFKLKAFVVSAVLAGAAGALYGLNYTTLIPSKFGFNLSILILVYVVLGGLGNMTGTIISTIVLVLLPELLRGLQDYRMIIYSVILILTMILSNNEKVKTFAAGLRKKLTGNRTKEAAADE